MARQISKTALPRQLQPLYGPETEVVFSRTEEPLTKKVVHHVAFLKVHKAASSTAQNIFVRYGWYRNLTFVLPPAKNPFGNPNIISLRESLTNSNILPPPEGRHYDILCNHVFYTNEAFRKFMPNDTVFIGILREPFDLFKSILDYFRPGYIYKEINTLFPASTFLRDPARYEPKQLTASWTNNRMALEYGFPKDLFSNYSQDEVDKYLQKLGGEFKVILLVEYMEESVIIMRRYLNWETKDILYLSQNNARKKNESILLNAFDRQFYKSYAKLDYALYNFFYKRLREQIREEGEDFDEELLQFKELRNTIEEYCKQVKSRAPLHIDATRWGDDFYVTKHNCTDLMRLEQSFVLQVRLRQYGSKDI